MKHSNYRSLLGLLLLSMVLVSCSALSRGCGSRGKVCPSIYKPVCGVDQKTYGNACVAKAKVAYTGKCLAYKIKIPTCQKGLRLVRKEHRGKPGPTCPKGLCTRLVCQPPDPYVDGGYVDPTCKGRGCVVAKDPFKGSVFSCPRGFSPATVKTKAGVSRQRCKRQ